MDHRIMLDGDEIRSAIERADGNGAEDIRIQVIICIDKNGKIGVKNIYCIGTCQNEWSEKIK